jgi:hypothetical protein
VSYEEDDVITGAAVELLIDHQRREQDQQRQIAEKAEDARLKAEAARLALAGLAEEAVRVIMYRLIASPAEGGQGALKAGEFPLDEAGRPVTKEREDTAWEILSRIGVPRLRATAVAASIAAHTVSPGPGSPGWEPPEEDAEEGAAAIGVGEVDAQIEAFLAGADAADRLRARRPGQEGEAA